MAGLRSVQITGTGMAVPDRVVTNQDLEAVLNTSDEWIRQRTGIAERRHVAPGQGPAELAHAAADQALRAAGVAGDALDLIIVATLSPEHYFPGTAAFLHQRLDLRTTPVIDLRCQCSGFLYALNVGQLFVASGQYQRVLVCGVEVHSTGLDMTPRGRDVSAIFGDGAGAVVLEPARDPERGIIGIKLHSEGRYADKLWVEAPCTGQTPALTPGMIEAGKVFPKMDGPFVFRHAVARMPEVIDEVLTASHLSVADVDLFLFHQANLRINEAVSRHCRLPPEKTYNNIERYGNCSAASIPMCLDDCVRSGRIKANSLVCMTAFGSGFSWASALIRW